MLDQEKELVVQQLETGKAVERFYYRQKPEKGILKIRRETNHIIWTSNQNACKVITPLVDIKEVRHGQCSKDFYKWPDDTRRVERSRCFIVFYGKEFKLKSLSIAALGTDECKEWITGLNHLMKEFQDVPYIIRLERFLRTEFYNMENSRNKIMIRDVKNFLPKIHYRTTNTRLKMLFDLIDDQNRGEIGFDQFLELVKRITWDDQEDRKMFPLLDGYCENGYRVTLQEFESFLVEEQNESEYQAASIIKNFVEDPQRNVQEPYFLVEEFMQYLFSKTNEVWDRRYNKVTQDMTRPLSHYWIASSHNTYLTGDQIGSESSTEAYARALRQGCRCIELDCWNGPRDLPIIFHGHTLTSKIGFQEVITTIRDHAFVTSSYPVILSIENHCDLPQQQEMARLFKEVFKDSLLVAPIEGSEQEMPSPEKLKGKIILKHAKLPGGTDERTPVAPTMDEQAAEQGLNQVVLKGCLYLRNPVDFKAWELHMFFLSQHSLSFTEYVNEQDDIDDQASGLRHSGSESEDDAHKHQTWYHGKLPGGRNKAEELLQHYRYLGNGTFLVRRSDNFVGDHTLSFWNQGKANHCHIRMRHEGDTTTYKLRENDSFPNLNALIEHYRTQPIRAQDLSVVLGAAVPQLNAHEREEWYHPNLSKEEAEECLGHIRDNGAFLVRPSKDPGYVAISFRAGGCTKHCRVKQEDHLFTMGTASFESLVDLVKYYERNDLFRKVKLRYPVTKRVMEGLLEQEQLGIGQSGGYVTYLRNIHVKAKYNYTAQKADELTFPRHAIIQNVNKVEKDWWKGDYGGLRQYWFPAIFVEEIQPDNIDEGGGDGRMLGDMLKGSVDLRGVEAHIECYTEKNRWKIEYVIRLMSQSRYQVLEIGCVSEQLAREWAENINTIGSRGDLAQTGQQRGTERRIKKELSDLVVYFRCVNFDMERRCHSEISSFPEHKMEKHINTNPLGLLDFHKIGFSRIYPRSARVESSNYNPMPFWNHGCQMVSLNYQTGDKSMQLNEGMFLHNGKCGYVLRPDCQFNPAYEPSSPNNPATSNRLTLQITIFGARHLVKTGRGCISPSVEVEIIGCEYDNRKCSTRAVRDNGLNPVWCERMEFEVRNPDCALIRFVVNDEDIFGENIQIGQATYPVKCIREGFRSVPLKNGYSEEIELASLLIQLKIIRGGRTQIMLNVQRELIDMLENARRNNDIEEANRLEEEINKIRPSCVSTST